jgi:hypothetical protein
MANDKFDISTITLDDTIDVSNITSTDTITIDTMAGTGASGTFTVDTGFADNIYSEGITFDSGNWVSGQEFVDHLPSIDKVKSMCAEYPALEQAYEKFKHIYNLVKDDYNNGEDDELPF